MKKIANHFYPHFATKEYCLCVRDHVVYKYCYANGELIRYFKIPPSSNTIVGKLKDWFARSAVGRLLNRSIGLSHVIELPSKTVLVIYDKVYRFNPEEHKHCAEVAASLDDVNALPPLRNGIGIHPTTGDCYFSEYSNDPYRAKSIFRLFNDGKSIECVHQFDVNEIKHVHSITWDKYRDAFWVTTGDSDEQSWFYKTDNNFETIERFAGGDQSWRAVSVVPTVTGLIWGMDAGKDAKASDLNFIYSLDLASQQRIIVQKIDAPAYHVTTTLSGKIIVNTNYEPGCKQPITAEAAVWVSCDGISWEKVVQLPYEPTPNINGSKYAYIYSPLGCVPDEHYLFTATNVAKNPMQLTKLAV